MAKRLRDEAGPELKTMLWTATMILLGLDHPKEHVYLITKEITTMILGIRGIEESSVYQDIFSKGRAEGEAKGRAEGEAKGRAEGEAEGIAETLLRIGRKMLGPPDERVRATILAITDRGRLSELSDRIAEVSTWEELLAPAGSQIEPEDRA